MQIQFLPMNKKLEVNSNKNLLEAVLECSIDINPVCLGNGTCGKCKVLLTKGNQRDFDETEKRLLTKEEMDAGIRLACRVHVTTDSCVIIPNETRIIQENSERKSNKDQEINLKEQIKKELIFKDYYSINNKLLKENLIHSESTNIAQIIDNFTNGNYGAAFDLGTTSVEAALYNLDTKQKLVQLVTGNPQHAFGADVISRISFCNRDNKNLLKMQKLITDCCNDLIVKMLKNLFLLIGYDEDVINKSNVNSNKIVYNGIKRSVFMGNTTMAHIFWGESVKNLARSPFQPTYEGIVHQFNTECTFHMNAKADLIMLPGISGHVGSDTFGCILATDLMSQKGNNLIIDIGTNGEMVLSKNGNMICCSTAAGPAFEGASIYQGMRASEGAIKGVKIIDNEVVLDIVGDTISIGICGSGIIDAIAELINAGIIDETGRIQTSEEVKSPLSSRITNENGIQFVLAYTQNGQKIVLTQNDIREVQLAKAAIYTGTLSLLKESKVEMNDIDRLYIAGAFGSNLNIANAVRIGLLPKIDTDKITLIGNGSLEGGAKVLLSEITESEAIKIIKNIRHIELANYDEFRQKYIEAINFI